MKVRAKRCDVLFSGMDGQWCMRDKTHHHSVGLHMSEKDRTVY